MVGQTGVAKTKKKRGLTLLSATTKFMKLKKAMIVQSIKETLSEQILK